MTRKIIPFLFLVGILSFVLSGCGENEIILDIEQPDNPEAMSLEELEEMGEALGDLLEEERESNKVMGSCNSIPSSSICVDYIGSFWTWEQIQLQCSGGNMVPSKNACPYSDYGGCNTGAGQMIEMVSWFYKEGAGGYNEENKQYAIGVCNATMNAQWTTPEDIF